MEYIKLTDKLPDEHRRYLTIAFINDCFIEAVCCYMKEDNVWSYERREVEVSHWQPLPKAPN